MIPFGADDALSAVSSTNLIIKSFFSPHRKMTNKKNK